MPLPKAMEKIEDFLKEHPVVHAFWGFLFGWNVGAIVLGISNAIDIKLDTKVWLWPVKPAAQKHPLKHPLNILFLPLAVPGIFLAVAIMGVTALSAAAFYLIKKGIQKISRKSNESDENTGESDEFNQSNRDTFSLKETKPPVTSSFQSSSHFSPPSFFRFPSTAKDIEGIFSDETATEKAQLALLRDIQKKHLPLAIKVSITELYTIDSPVADKLWTLLGNQYKNSEFVDLYNYMVEWNSIKTMCQVALNQKTFEIFSAFNKNKISIAPRKIAARAIVRFLFDLNTSLEDKAVLRNAIIQSEKQLSKDTPSMDTPSIYTLVKQFLSEQPRPHFVFSM